MGASIQKRIDGFDILKCLAAFFIICIHAPFDGEFGEYVIAIARIGVPAFLMISGYFYCSIVNNDREFKQIKKTLLLVLGANLLYFVYGLGSAVIEGTAAEYFAECFSIKSIFAFLALNESPFGFHLWYLGALLYTHLFVAFLRKFVHRWEKLLYIITPFLLVADLVLGKYVLLFFGRELVPYIIIRNFIFVGIPFFSVGLFINRHQEMLSSVKKHTVILWIAAILFTLTTCLERFMLISLNANGKRDQYISTFLLVVVLFLIFDDPVWNSRKIGFLKKIGREYSLMIYIIHPIIKWGLLRMIGDLSIYKYLCPFLVFAGSIAFSALYYMAKKQIRAKLSHKSNE